MLSQKKRRRHLGLNLSSPAASDTQERVNYPTKTALVSVAIFSAIISTLWAFPSFWYADRELASGGYAWFAEESQVAGWEFTHVAVGKTAEAILVADRIANGEFTRADGRSIQVYSAKRYLEKENEIGLFSHTPDRCWTATGWKIEPANPDFVECTVHGVRILFERRIFAISGQRQLVYFGALVGGEPVPHRLDQYYAAGVRRKESTRGDSEGTLQRILQPRLWSWAWDSFLNRTPFRGPQQFVRISTPIRGNDDSGADRLLAEFLPLWLKRTEYGSEFQAWKTHSSHERAQPDAESKRTSK